MARIFLVEDNDNVREATTSYFRLSDHEVMEFTHIGGVLDALVTRKPDLIVLDVMLPDGDGFLLAREIRKKSSIPIIFLTAKSAESDRIAGFEVGGDDYVVKPFSPKELVLRAEAVLRRTGAETKPGTEGVTWRFQDSSLQIDPSSMKVSRDGTDLHLTAAEWRILIHLAEHAGIVVQRESLLGEALDYFSAEGSERTVDTHIKNLRAKLGHPGWIETVRGFGYRFAGAAR